MLNFQYQALHWNIIFAAGAVSRLSDELDRLGLSKAIVLCTPNQQDEANKIVKLLGHRAVGLFDQVKMHVPEATVEKAIAEVQRLQADCSVAIGGGSTTGLGKALVAKLNLANIAIPTSYAGSEMTNIWAISEAGRKIIKRDNRVVPTLTIYDPELTLSLPPAFAAASGMNAIAQAVVNVATDNINPIISTMALEAVRALFHSLPIIIADPDNMAARAEALYGACMAGAALGTGSTSLHHRLCHTFGGAFNTPHAETHAILLPHSVAYNAAAAAPGTRKLAEVMGTDDAATALFDLANTVGVVTALKDIAVQESDLDKAVEIAMETPINNAEEVTAKRLRKLLDNAFHGRHPVAIA